MIPEIRRLLDDLRTQLDQQHAAVQCAVNNLESRLLASPLGQEAPAPQRCEGRYSVPATSPPRDEPFEVTYRCALRVGHAGPHGAEERSEP